MKTLQQKIKKVILLSGMTYRELARKLGVSGDNLYKWRDGANPRSFKEQEKVNKGLDEILETFPKSEFSDLQLEYLEGKKPEKLKSLMMAVFLDGDGDPVVYNDKKAIPGTVIEVKGKPALIVYQNESPVIGNVDGLLGIEDDSMAPLFTSGAVIAIRKLKFFKILVTGKYYYIIDKNYDGTLRRIIMANGGKGIQMISENKEKYPSIIRNFDEIAAIFKVDAVIKKI